VASKALPTFTQTLMKYFHHFKTAISRKIRNNGFGLSLIVIMIIGI